MAGHDDIASLYAQRRARIERICRRRLMSDWDADDAAQETFLRFLNHKGESPRNAGPYLDGIAHNVCMNELRRRYRADRKDLVEDLVVNAEEIATTRKAIVDLWNAINPRDRSMIVQAYLGYGSEEIAAAMGTTAGAIRVRLCRLRRKLADQAAV